MNALTVISIAAAAALASVIGGLIALWRKPTTLFMSSVLGFASGVLLATFSFEMIPQAPVVAAREEPKRRCSLSAPQLKS